MVITEWHVVGLISGWILSIVGLLIAHARRETKLRTEFDQAKIEITALQSIAASKADHAQLREAHATLEATVANQLATRVQEHSDLRERTLKLEENRLAMKDLIGRLEAKIDKSSEKLDMLPTLTEQVRNLAEQVRALANRRDQ